MIKRAVSKLKVFLLAFALAFTALGLSMFTFSARAAETQIDPRVWYKFNDSSDPGKDAMGNYNLSKIVPSGAAADSGVVTVENGWATFNGTASLAGASESQDVSEVLTNFTLVFKMIPDANQGTRGPVAGFSWNNWGATKYGWFTLGQGGTDGLNPLRFSTHGVGDGSAGRDWGYEVKKDIVAGTEYSLALSVQLGGKIVVYIDGVATSYSFNVPVDWNLQDINMRFAIGGDCTWGYLYEGFKGKISDVKIYDFAMTGSEVAAYEKNGALTVSDLTSTPVSAEVDLTESVRVPADADEAEILKNLPTTSLIDVVMSDESVRKGTARWETVVKSGKDTYVEGTITDIANPNGVKARAKITVVEEVVDILPAVSYEFASEETMLKDSVNGFDLTAVGEPEWSADGVTLTQGDMLYDAGDAAGKDSVEYLKDATYSVKFRINSFSNAAWWFLFSTGDIDERDRSAGFNLLVQGDSMLRIDTGIHDSWWGGELGTVEAGKWYQVDCVFDLEGRYDAEGDPMVYVYVNGAKISQGVLVPVPLSGTGAAGDPPVQWEVKPGEFAYQKTENTGMGIGGLYNNGTPTIYDGETSSVTFSTVKIYDFAMNDAQIETLNKADKLQSNSVESYIAAVDTEVSFGDNQPTKTQLLTSMPQEELVANLNAATAMATLSDGTTRALPVNWLSVAKDESDGKWYAYGMVGGLGCGLPSAVGKTDVKTEVSVLAGYKVTLEQSQNGTIATNVSGGTTGTEVIVTPAPAEHYYTKWIKVDGVELQPADGVYSFLIADKDVTVTVEFAQTEYELSVEEATGGTILLSAEKAVYGTVIEITPTPDAHYALTGVTVNGAAIQPEGGKYIFTVQGDTTVSATFEAAVYNVDVIPSKNGTAEADKTSGSYGDVVTVTVTPAEGYVVKSVMVNEKELAVGTDGKYTFEIEADSVIQAVFEKESEQPGPGSSDSSSVDSSVTTSSGKDSSSGTTQTAGCGSMVAGASVMLTAALICVGVAIRKKND